MDVKLGGRVGASASLTLVDVFHPQLRIFHALILVDDPQTTATIGTLAHD
ncbi:MAG: hypothetical protein SFZ02_06250 [bacterium]|nr:hypothetical protein [bacterium]